MLSLTFNDTRKSYLMVTHRVRKYWATRELVLSQNRTAGARLRKVRTGVRVEEVRVEVSALESLGMRKTAEDLSNWLLTDSEKPLIFDDEKDRTYYAIVDSSFDAEEIVSVGYGTIRFICPDPYKYGEERTIELGPQTTYVDVSGHVETPWKTKSTITLPQSEYTLDLRTSKITITYNFIAGDVLEIDYKKREILLNGKELDKGLSIESSWGLLQPGNFGLSASQPTTLTYTERYN